MGSHSCPAVRQREQGVESVRSHRTRRKLQDVHATLALDSVVGILPWELGVPMGGCKVQPEKLGFP
jgi:hypothetical protein